jgi:tetratricopeptide (TPR) repeat protein
MGQTLEPTMRRFARIVVAGMAAATLGAGPAAAEDAGGSDQAKWIASACAAGTGHEELLGIDQVAGKALSGALKAGRYREAVRLADAYLGCLDRIGDAPWVAGLAERKRALRQVACFVPLAIFEVERRVDDGLATASLATCPEPSATVPADAKERRAWAEDVRRHMHLVAAARPPAEVLRVAGLYLDAMTAAGMTKPEPAPPAEGKPPDAAKDEGETDEGPDPMFAARVFVAGAAVATGDLDRLVAMEGGDEAACRSTFLATLSVLQVIRLPRASALPLVLHRLVSRATLADLAKVSAAARKRFNPEDCAVRGLVASLGLASRTAAEVDDAVASGRLDEVATLSGDAVVISLPGKPATRAAVLERVVALAPDSRKGARSCQLGDARLEAGDFAAARRDYEDARARLGEGERACATLGRLRAIAADPAADPSVARDAAAEYLAAGPDAAAVLAAIREGPDDEARVRAVRAFDAAIAGAKEAARDAVREAFVKVVDESPGTSQAVAAVAALPADGGAKEPGERAMWGLIVGRHHVASGQAAAARKAIAAAMKAAKPDMKPVVGGTATFLRWLAARKHYDVLDDAVRRAMGARIVDAGTVAQLAGIVGEVGERKRAATLLKAAERLKPASETEWLAIASAYARVEDVARATAALSRVGAQNGWGPGPWMVKGRIETVAKRYREAANAYGKAADQARGECEPLFFRGLVMLLMGDPEGGEQDFRKCVSLGDDSAQVLGGLAYALFDQSRFDEAEKTFRSAIAKDEKAADNHIGLAMALLRSGRTAEAVDAFRKAGTLEPAMAQGYDATERKGYVYSDVEKKAWEDLAGESARSQEK